jgi:hypothetical protein
MSVIVADIPVAAGGLAARLALRRVPASATAEALQ